MLEIFMQKNLKMKKLGYSPNMYSTFIKLGLGIEQLASMYKATCLIPSTI
jgi:hypothetical protein